MKKLSSPWTVPAFSISVIAGALFFLFCLFPRSPWAVVLLPLGMWGFSAFLYLNVREAWLDSSGKLITRQVLKSKIVCNTHEITYVRGTLLKRTKYTRVRLADGSGFFIVSPFSLLEPNPNDPEEILSDMMERSRMERRKMTEEQKEGRIKLTTFTTH